MNALQLLVQNCPPPGEINPQYKSQSLFDGFNLSSHPPEDLLELYKTYGTGSFWCETENLDLLDPCNEAPEELDYIVKSARSSDADGLLSSDFFLAEDRLPRDVILWGHTSNGILLASLKPDSRMNWMVVAIGNLDVNSIGYFKSATEVLFEYISGTLPQRILGEWTGATTFRSDPK